MITPSSTKWRDLTRLLRQLSMHQTMKTLSQVSGTEHSRRNLDWENTGSATSGFDAERRGMDWV
jgi:hypothetical protein